jgi:hypothetical protein
MYADLCSRRQIEIQEQQLRSFVVKHSIVQIHCILAFALIVIALTFLTPVHIEYGRDILAGLLLFAGSAIAASSRNIAKAVTYSRG